ncbi:MAG: alanine racemase [Erysipelotrichaceae bacterium]|nr:alanine racemase [Erysipelotrichaceae bacterium]
MYRNTWMEVNLDAIAENVHRTKDICGKKYIAVLKADAYGCGDQQVANAVLEAGADMLAVSSLDEALMLRNEGYDGKILILGAVDAQDALILIQHHISTAAYSKEWVDAVTAENCQDLQVHLAVDTGMNRIGFKDIPSLQKAFDQLKKAGCRMEGIFTHFFCSDQLDHKITDQQYQKFAAAVKALQYPFEWIHCDNSDATIFFKDEISNACRVGISLYGISPYKKDLKKAISLHTCISMTKHVAKGETIGYGATYTADSDQIIATMPIGYADGFIRANQGRKVYVDGQMAEIVGRVCMDQCMVRLDHDVAPGTEVEVFGDHIDLEEMADELKTISYEIICLISGRVTRKYIWHGCEYGEDNPRLSRSGLNQAE